MGKRRIIIFASLMIIIAAFFTRNAYAATLKASNSNELQSIVLKQLNLTNQNFSIIYTGSIDDIDDIMKNILEKDSYLACTVTSMEWTTTNSKDGSYIIKIETDYIISAYERKETDKKIDEIIASIIKPCMTDHEKVKAIHDYIVLNSKYDTNMEYYSDYDLLEKGTSVCNGYALFNYNILNKINIPVKLVFGFSNQQSHVWNMVKLGDYWFHLDTTWDDPVPDRGSMISYNYYLLTDEEIQKDHKIDDNQNLPKTKLKYYNYLKELSLSSIDNHVYENLLIETGLDIYSKENTADTKEQLAAILKAKIKFFPSVIFARYVKDLSKEDISSAMSELFDSSGISEISYDHANTDNTGNYNILNLLVKYKESPDSIISDISEDVYNTETKVKYHIYGIYGTTKKEITEDVKLYPYNENFINIIGNTITFNDSGSQKLIFEYKGKKLEACVTAINSASFDYITDTKSDNPVNVKIYDHYIDFNLINQWPFIEDGRTLVPLRAVFEVLNCNVSWEETSNSAVVEHGNTRIVIPANSQSAYINGSSKKLDVPAKIVNNRIMVPLRFISESINKKVLWDNKDNTVLIY